MSFIPLSKADMDILEKEKREIERRRKEEAARKKIFFDDKQRRMGVDTDAIAQQIREKEEVKVAAKEEDKQYRHTVESFVEKLSVLDADRVRYHQQKAYAVGQHQKNTSVKDSDTFYLNDPDQTKKDVPPRTEDAQEVPSCALQKFDGEDLAKNERIKSQQAELRKWCQQIEAEKHEHSAAEKESVQKYVEERDAALKRMEAVEANKRAQGKQSSVRCAKANLQQMAEKESREEDARRNEATAAEIEVEQMVKSKFLNETWDSTVRSGDGKRFIPYNFKGFSQEQRQSILDEQSAQIKDHLLTAKQLEQKEQDYNEEQVEYARKALLQLRNAQRLKQQNSTELAATHKAQITETHQKTEQLDAVYANKVTPAFFDQFGTSTR